MGVCWTHGDQNIDITGQEVKFNRSDMKSKENSIKSVKSFIL